MIISNSLFFPTCPLLIADEVDYRWQITVTCVPLDYFKTTEGVIWTQILYKEKPYDEIMLCDTHPTDITSLTQHLLMPELSGMG